MLLAVSFLVVNRVLIDIDPRSVTAAALCGRLDQIVLMPIFALSASLMTIVGQNIGRGRRDRARNAWRTGVKLSVATTVVIAALVMAAAPWVYRLFSADETVLSYTVKQTRTVELSFAAAALVIMARSVFQALGRPLPGLVITFLRTVVFVVPFMVFFVYVLDWGLYGVWGGMIAGNLLGGVVSMVWVRNYWNRLESGKTDYVHTGN
jgi:Na+-driven multidrug efflux pump